MKTRCSKLDTAMACASSLAETDNPYTPQSDAAEEGTTHHESLSFIPKGEDPPLEEIADRSGIDVGDLGRMVYYGRQAWKEIAASFPEAQTEVRLDSEITGGTSDVVSLPGAAIADWKSGWGQNEHPWQLTGYAYCFRAEHGMPERGYIGGVEIWLRHKTFRVHRFTDAALDAFAVRLQEHHQEIGKQYGPGRHCDFCPHVNHCTARAEYVRATCEALAPIGETGITREKLGALYEQAKALRSALAQFDKLIDAELDKGPIPMGDGRTIQRLEHEQDEIDPLKAWPVIFNGPHPLTAEQAVDVIDIGKTRLLAAVKSQAPKGSGAAFERDVMKALKEVGAISKITRTKKTIVAA